MGLSANLSVKQGQSLVMTPQLMQAVKLLQMSNVELSAYVEGELEKNPLLEVADGANDPLAERDAASDDRHQQNETEESTFSSDGGDPQSVGVDDGEPFDADRQIATTELLDPSAFAMASPGLGETSSHPSAAGDALSFEAYTSNPTSLHEHLSQQLAIAIPAGHRRLIGEAIIGSLDQSGYLREPLEEIAARLGTDIAATESVLADIQTFDPSGVGARDLAECLAIQLRENDRFDPAMQIFVANLPLVAAKDVVTLSRLCGVDLQDIAEMATELKKLNPKPGNAFGDEPIQSLIPDVFVWPASDGSWYIELNVDTLPRLLVNNRYATRVSENAKREEDRTFVSNCLESANWLIRSLEQRQKTILAVVSEIVRLQGGFLSKGIEYLRPLTMQAIAEAIGVHESTVSRATSHKFVSTPRGVFALKTFFTQAIKGAEGAEDLSSEAVRHKIKQLIEQETPSAVLSDDAMVKLLSQANVQIARRTVAKYRESLGIPSSVDRRKSKSRPAEGAAEDIEKGPRSMA